jgi:zinc protease
MIDRNTPPAYVTIKKVGLAPIQYSILKSGLPLYFLANSQLKVFRLELVFKAGSIFGQNTTDAFFTSILLNSGTDKLTSTTIIQKFESLGATFESSQGFENFTVRLMGLSEYFNPSVDLLKEVMFNAVFPENELELAKNRQIQSYRIGLEKSDVVCNQLFRKNMFGANTAYGNTIDEQIIGEVNRGQLQAFYDSNIQSAGFTSYLAGNISEKQCTYFTQVFENANPLLNTEKLIVSDILPLFNEKLEKEKAVQCSIKMGNRSIRRKDADYPKFLVSNVLFGGFFGSRLMKNIREEKGLTYGISSSASPVGPNWVWSINSAVKKENIGIVTTEIEKELEIIKSQKPNDGELQTVKNYISGSVLSGMNTVFDIIDKHRLILQEELPVTYYEDLLPAVHAVKPSDVVEMAQKYMSNLSSLIVG